MKVTQGKRVSYNSYQEYYLHQARRSNPHDNNRLVTGRNAEILHFLMFGGTLAHTEPLVKRADPNFPSDVKFLDVGCRDGWSLDYLRKGCPKGFTLFRPKKRFKNTCGLELVHKTVEHAVRRGRNVIQGDIRCVIIAEDAFDIIYTRHCLEHLDDPLQGLKNITKMLKPGGTLLAIVPMEEKDIDPDKSSHSYLFRNDNELADMSLRAGLTVTSRFTRKAYSYKKRKYWYKLTARLRHWGPELWVFATKSIR